MRILLAENSPFVIKVISDLLQDESEMELCGICKSWPEIMDSLNRFKPDVLVMSSRLNKSLADEMVREIMIVSPVAILLLCGKEQSQTEASLRALRFGALDIILKPEMPTTFNVEKIGPELLSGIRMAARVRVIRHVETSAQVYVQRARQRLDQADPVSPEKAPHARNVVAIGVSTGGPPVLHTILASLPPDLPAALIIAQHMPGEFVGEFINQLSRNSLLRVARVEHNLFLREATAYVAGGDVDVEITPDGRIRVIPTTGQSNFSPSVNLLFESLSQRTAVGKTGIILTGMGRDGARGAAELRRSGGTIIVQSPDTCAVSAMPDAIIEARLADYLLPPGAIGPKIRELIAGH
jgi:two-component system chemotaxis response regulator CheB